MKYVSVLLLLSCLSVAQVKRGVATEVHHGAALPTGAPQWSLFVLESGSQGIYVCRANPCNTTSDWISAGVVAVQNTPWVVIVDPTATGDACSKIAAAITALPTQGGTVDARGLTGAQTCGANPFSTVGTKAGIVLLGNVQLAVSASIVVPSGWRLVGISRGAGTTIGTTISGGGGFVGKIIRIGDFAATGLVLGARIENMFLDCVSNVNCTALYSDAASDQSGASNVLIGGVSTVAGLQFTSACTKYVLQDIEVSNSSTAPIGTVRVALSGLGYITRLTMRSNSTNIVTNSLTLDGFTGSLSNVSVLSATNGINIGSTTASLGMKIDGVTGASDVTNMVTIGSTSTGISILNWNKKSSTNAIVDTNNSITLTDAVGTFYYIGIGGAGDYAYLDTSGLHTGKPMFLGSVAFASLPAAANGSVVYCSNCNSTCSASGGTGRTCFRENGTWVH